MKLASVFAEAQPPLASKPLSPELRLLLAAGQPPSIEDRAIFSTLFAQVSDLDELVKLGRFHGLLPLLHWRIAALPIAGLAKAVRDEFHENARRSRLLSGELVRVLNLLARAHVPAIALKGPVVASALYGHAGLRVFGDLDSLIPRRDVVRASQALEESGYCQAPHLGDQRERWEHALKLVRSDAGTTVELHWALTPEYLPCAFDFDALFKRSRDVQLAGSTVTSLGNEDLALYLCLHGQRHNWIRLEWICSLARLLQPDANVNWTAVLTEARRLRIERIVLIGARLASDLFAVPLPAAVAAKMNACARRLANIQAARILLGPSSESDGPRSAFLPMLARECFWDRCRYASYLWHWLSRPTSEDRKVLALPNWLSLLYWIIRPVRLLWESV